MRKLLLFILLLIIPTTALAERVYCGDFNGQPAYVDIDSISRESSKTGSWEVTNSGAYPEYKYSYYANIYADGLWYKVCFDVDRRKSYLAWILDKNKNSTGKHVDTISFDFAFDTVEQYYPEANQRRQEFYRKKNEEQDRKNIEDAKRNQKQ
ncbi:MAG: hypothetical protein P4N41_18235 [Negativicutes bacterium]|nr:hypothetical protein [Negativicutes bacterium]